MTWNPFPNSCSCIVNFVFSAASVQNEALNVKFALESNLLKQIESENAWMKWQLLQQTYLALSAWQNSWTTNLGYVHSIFSLVFLLTVGRKEVKIKTMSCASIYDSFKTKTRLRSQAFQYRKGSFVALVPGRAKDAACVMHKCALSLECRSASSQLASTQRGKLQLVMLPCSFNRASICCTCTVNGSKLETFMLTFRISSFGGSEAIHAISADWRYRAESLDWYDN